MPVLDNRHLAEDICVLSLNLRLDSFPQPGTFLHIKPSAANDPFFRRAFSIYDYYPERETADILFKVFGRGSGILAKLREGERINVLGPLGNGFPTVSPERELLLAAGGVGLPPIYLLAKTCLSRGHPKERITFLFGMTSKKDQVLANRLPGLMVPVDYSTDDGSLGYHGFVSELLERKLRDRIIDGNLLICACGPEGMLKAVQQIAHKYNVETLLSLESVMPCGVGTCLGCVVAKAGEEKYLRVCREGPVFNANEVAL